MAKNNHKLNNSSYKISRLLADGKQIDAAMKRAARAAVRRHRLAGNPVAEWRNGKVVWTKS
jgi:hypothetical protein